jgi:hypothetical protein
MARSLFIAQEVMDGWIVEEKVDFDNNIITIKSDGRKFKLVEAVRFITVEGGDEDKPALIGRVKTNDQLDKMGAERYRDSVIFDDIAYKVQEGYVGEVFVTKVQEESPAGPSEGPIDAASLGRIKKTGTVQAAKPVEKETPVKKDVPVLEKKKEVPQEEREFAQARTQPELQAALQSILGDRAGAKADDKKNKDDVSDEELLTKFLLDNL